jgi:hypothetical protein
MTESRNEAEQEIHERAREWKAELEAKERTWRFRVAVASGVLAGGGLALADPAALWLGVSRFWLIPLPLVLAAFSLIGFLMLYLRGELLISFPFFEHAFRAINPVLAIAADVKRGDRKQEADRVGRLESELEKVNSRVNDLEFAPLPHANAATAAEVATAILPTVRQDLGEIFEARYERQSAKAHAASDVATRFEAAVHRLEREIASQSLKGQLNLAIGVTATIFAIGVISWMALADKLPSNNWFDLVNHYVPRLSLAILIEVFAFFFLRMYRTTLEDARKYNDDLSRLTLQWVAVEVGRFAEESGETLALAKDLLGLTTAPRTAATSGTTVDPEYLVKAANALTALAREIKRDDKSVKKDKQEDKGDD